MFSFQCPRVFRLVFSLGCVAVCCVAAPLQVARAQMPAQISALGNLSTTDGMRLQISTESATDVFFERETLRTQTPIEWTIRAWNTLPQARKLRLSWRIIDASGKEVQKEGEKTDFLPATEVRRRRFFQPKMLGVYRVEVEARAERNGADDLVRVQQSFAVLASPLNTNLPASPLSVPSFSVENASALSASEAEWFRALNLPVVIGNSSINGKNWPDGLAVQNAEMMSGASANAWRFLEAQPASSGTLALRDEVKVNNDREIVSEVSSSIKRSILAKLSGATTSTRWPTQTQNAFARAASGAAWAQMARLLENAVPEGRVFEPSPLLWGASFTQGANRIVALWDDGSANGKSRLVTQLEGVRVLDLWGNEIARSEKNKLVIPLSDVPVYVLTSSPQTEVLKAWRNARWEGTAPIQTQILPFARPIVTGTKDLPRVLVRVQNVSWLPFEGRVGVDVPKRWKVANDRLNVKLQPGETKLLSYVLTAAERKTDNVYNLETEVFRGRSDWKTRQDVPVATVSIADEVRVDGALDEWNLASWMNMGGKDDATQARLALRTDESNLYIACQVRENALQIRDESSTEYSFWNGDAIQIALGVRNVNPLRENLSDSLGARDSDYGFLLSPFAVGEDGAPSGRVLRLWSPQFAFGAAQDRVRWGGVVTGARCIVRRDDQTKLTIWEAAIPLSQIAELQPVRRLANNELIRFGWVLNNDDGAPLEWANQVNSFPWKRGTGSFLPETEISGGAQTYAGFSGIVSPLSTDSNADLHFDGSIWNPPVPTSTPTPTSTPSATPRSTPAPVSTPKPTPSATPRASSTRTPTPQVLPPLPPAPASSLPPMRPEPLPQLPSPPQS